MIESWPVLHAVHCIFPLLNCYWPYCFSFPGDGTWETKKINNAHTVSFNNSTYMCNVKCNSFCCNQLNKQSVCF